MYVDSVKWASGHAVYRQTTVGPRHDPYARSDVTLTLINQRTREERTFTLTSCGLAGAVLQCPDGTLFREDDLGSEEFEALTERRTGFNFRYWMDILWHRLSQRRPDFEDYDMGYYA